MSGDHSQVQLPSPAPSPRASLLSLDLAGLDHDFDEEEERLATPTQHAVNGAYEGSHAGMTCARFLGV
jgi:hypothetical protein